MAQDCAWCPPSRSWRSPLYLVTSLEEEVAGVWAAAAPLGMHSGKTVRHPSGSVEPAGWTQRSYPRRVPTPFLGSPDRQQRRAVIEQGFHPQRPQRAAASGALSLYPVRVCWESGRRGVGAHGRTGGLGRRGALGRSRGVSGLRGFRREPKLRTTRNPQPEVCEQT